MALWGNSDYQNNAPKSTTYTSDRVAKKRLTGAGNVATTTSVAEAAAITSFNNTTIGAFQSLTAVGTFGVTTNETQQAAIKGKGVSPGWVNVRFGTGPVTGITFAASNATFNTSSFANGETVIISGATTNGSATITTNATGNAVSLSVTNGGSGFTNAAAVTLAFARQRKVSLIVVAGTATGYNNTDIFTVSNGISNATASVSTNATGGTLTFTITNPGLFSNTAANASAVVAVTNATGGATGGSGATFTANLTTSTNTGAVLTVTTKTLGGRANRVQYENLVYIRSMNSTVDSENTVFANT
jgi:hypothetical protein